MFCRLEEERMQDLGRKKNLSQLKKVGKDEKVY